MNLQTIFDLAREQTFVSSDNFSDESLLKYLNVVYHDLANAIISIDEKFFFESFTSDIIAGKNEYQLPQKSEIFPGIQKLVNISVMYGENEDFVKLKGLDFTTFVHDKSYYEKNQPKINPIYVLADNSFFIYPTPDSSIINGLKLDAIVNLIDLKSTSLETDIRIPNEYHNLLVLGMKQYIFAAQSKIDEKKDSKQEYELEKFKMQKELTDRSLTPIEGLMVNLQNLE